MSNIPENTPIAEASPQQLREMIAELEQYRQRLVHDTLAQAQKAKVNKTQALENLESKLNQIDGILASLRQQQADNSVVAVSQD